jgi:hypothetical protein
MSGQVRGDGLALPMLVAIIMVVLVAVFVQHFFDWTGPFSGG